MKKLATFLLVLAALTLGLSSADAAVKYIGFTTSASTACATAGVVYQVVLGTGTAGNYVVFRDSATANTTSTPMLPRNFFGSTTASTSIVYDPPVPFYYGLSINMSAATDEVGVNYECGRGIKSSR